MDFNFDLELVQAQKLLLTPKLKQALEILKMSSQELFEYVEEELEKNPVLEIDEIDSYMDEDEQLAGGMPDAWENDMRSNTEVKLQEDESLESIEDYGFDKSTARLSLKEHLLFQLHVSGLDEKKNTIGEYLIDNIDENGYLAIDLSEVAKFYNMPLVRVKNVLEHLQTFDPPGICARNLRECLIIQLKQLKNSNKDINEIIENYLDDLAENRVSTVSKKTGFSTQRINEIYNFIKTLEPKPGRAFYDSNEIRFLIPDIIVKKINNRFEVLINEDSIPLLSINMYYKKILSEDITSESRKFIQNKIDSASWLIKCIEQRKETLRKISEVIVNKQQNFFEMGKNYIKPLSMKELAKEIDMHKSTVNRVVSGKYLQCSWGTFDIRYFFTGKSKSSL